jgi:hypothetical protein
VSQTKQTSTFAPFENDTQIFSVGNLRIENGAKKLSIFGELEIEANPSGREDLIALVNVLVEAIRCLDKRVNAITEDCPEVVLVRSDLARKNPLL